jgi:Cu/Ag efflux pump CusA
MIETPTGLVRLGDLADIRFAPSPSVIRRDAVKRYIDVHATINGRDFASVSKDIQAIITATAMPLEYHAEILNASQAQNIQQMPLLLLVAVVIGAFLLLQASFQSWRLALVTSLSVPAVLSGSVIAMFLGGGVISLGSVFGLLAVLVITIRNMIVTVSHMEMLKQKPGASLGQDLVTQGAQNRVVSIVMGAIASLLLVLPFVFAGNKAGTEILHPMAVVLLGGLVTSLLFNLFILPALYLHFAPKGQREGSPVVESNEAMPKTA